MRLWSLPPFLFPLVAPSQLAAPPATTTSDTLFSFLQFSSETFSSIPDGCLNWCIRLLACLFRSGCNMYTPAHTQTVSLFTVFFSAPVQGSQFIIFMKFLVSDDLLSHSY